MVAKSTFLSVLLAVTVLLSMAGCASAPPAQDTNAATLALVNGTLIDGTGAEPLPDAVVLIAGERILAVGTQDTLKLPEGVKTVDVGGATILPGFINAHVHYAYDKANLLAWAQGGVTTVRDEATLGQSLAAAISFRNEVNQEPQYARLVSAGAMMTVPQGYGSLYVTSPEDARKKALEELDTGADLIKVSLEDGYAGRSGLPKLTPEELAAIVTAAHERGTRVSGHITQGAYLQAMLDAGVDDIAHVPYDYIPRESLQEMVVKGVYLEPTFTVFRNYGAPVSACVANLHEFVKLGGQVALGNDYGGGPGDFELGIPMYEIQKMSEAGMTPLQIIVAGTKNAAHVSNLEDELGTLEAGKIADILVVGGNPLEDLQVLTDVRMVIHNGTIIRDEIQP